MWFFFGLFTLLSFFIYFLKKRINGRWKGTPGTENGVSYQFQVFSTKYNSTIGLKIGINTKKGYDFIFKKESWVDRLFKMIGLSIEHQVGSKEFDDLVVESRMIASI